MLTKKEIILSLLVLVFMLQVGSIQLYAQECKPVWITDKSTGCQVWDACPGPNGSVKWSGQCVDGKAHGKGQSQWYQNNDLKQIQFGEMINGVSQGKGQVQQYQNGELQAVQSGEMVNGQWQGKGQLQQYQNGELQLVLLGEIVNGQWQGKAHVQQYQHGELQAVQSGEMVNGQWQGKVQLQQYQNGELREVHFGEMINGHWQGDGQTYLYQTGQLTEIGVGSWKDGQQDGKFENHRPMGEVYAYTWFKNGQIVTGPGQTPPIQPTPGTGTGMTPKQELMLDHTECGSLCNLSPTDPKFESCHASCDWEYCRGLCSFDADPESCKAKCDRQYPK